MTQNHALKKEARALLARFSGIAEINYTQVLKLLQEKAAYDLRDNAKYLDPALIEAAAKHLLAGDDILVFGTAYTGKTTAIHSIMERLVSHERVLVDLYGKESGIKTDDSAYSFSFADVENFIATAHSEDLVIAIDEVRQPLTDELVSIVSSHAHIIGIHANSSNQAVERLAQLTDLSMKNTMFLQVDRLQNGERKVSLV